MFLEKVVGCRKFLDVPSNKSCSYFKNRNDKY